MGEVPRNPPIVAPPVRLGVCVSGEGTTLQNLIDQIKKRRLKAEIVQVVASRPRIGAIARAEAAHVPLALCNYNSRSKAEFSTSVFEPIRHAKADLVILAGFLSLLKIPPEYKGRVLNVHPALVPAFCGKGYYGARVHEAVLASGVKVSGCTVHFADNTYDTGPIVVQRAVPVLEDDTIDTLAARVFKEECSALPEAITLFADGRLKLDGRRVHIAPRA